MTPQSFQHWAKYNAWMNENIYIGCAKIPDEKRKTDMGAFFKSIHGTLNHLMVGDLIWLSRFKSEPIKIKLDGHLYGDFNELWAARRKLDGEISAFAAGLSPEWLAQPFTFKSVAYNREFTATTWTYVMHMFNHQTHHRGQVTALMMQCGVDPGPTDMPAMP